MDESKRIPPGVVTQFHEESDDAPPSGEGAESKSEMLSLIGREVGEPLNRILETAQQLRETDLSDGQRAAVEAVQRAGDDLLTVINNILDLSKIEAGKMVLETIDFDVHSMVAEVAGRLKESARLKGLEITCLIHHDVPAVLRGDPGRLRQVLTNFVSSMIGFTERAEIVASVKVLKRTAESVIARFEISEAGAELSHAGRREPVQASPARPVATAEKLDCTGLAFALAKRLTELMGGQFGVDDGKGAGPRVWFSVQLGQAAESCLDLPTPRTNLRGLAALAVVDNEGAYKNLVAQTLSWGMKCDMAPDASRALEALREAAGHGHSYDLAILDLQVPGTDGLELARAIRRDPALSAVRPVILISVGLRGHAEAARQAGIAGYLTKPVNQSELFNCLTTVMGVESHGAFAATGPLPPLVTSHNLKEAKSRRQPQVLVAEDNTVNQMVAVRMLEKLGIRPDVAQTGVGAVEACQRTDYDLVLMDCQMPEMDGFEATRAILDWEQERGGTHVPIIAVTANAMQGDREKCLAAGMDDYIAKPFRLEQLRELVARWARPPESRDLPSASPRAATPKNAIDPSALNDLRARPGDALDDFRARLKDQFLGEASSRLATIKEAAQRSDAAQLRQAAHGLKGSSGVMGAQTMAALCAALEQHGRDGDMTEVATLVAQLENEFSRVREELDAVPCG